MTEFERINQPRVDRALHQIELVRKSAKSTRASEGDLRALVTPIKTQLAPLLGIEPLVAVDMAQLERKVLGNPQLATPPVAKEMTAMADWSTQQLIDRMIACGAELAKRRQ